MQNNTHIYMQIEEILRDKIYSGEYPVGSALPSERTLAELYGVNRLTVRASIKRLQQLGVINSIHGKGNFVCKSKFKKNFTNFSGFGAELKVNNRQPSDQVVFAGVVPARYEISRQLDCSEGTPIYRLTRLRLSDGTATALEDAYIPLGLIPEIETIDFSIESLYQTFEKNGIHPSRAHQTLCSYTVPDHIAELLEMNSGGSAYRVEYRTYDTDNRLLEYTVSVINPSKATIASKLE